MIRSLLTLLLAVGCLGGALAAPEDKKDDPKSNNKDKIVGKWEAAGGVLVFEFTADGKFITSGAVKVQGKYSLGAGDEVHLTDLDPPLGGKTKSKEKITIKDDTMSIAGDGGKSTTFTRVKKK